MNINKLAFFGASVTKQTESYADKLIKILINHGFNCVYEKFGYGSMHLSDAGVCFVDSIIEYKPDICFIDWFSTAKTDYGDNIYQYLDAIVYKLLKNNIRPIFLLLPISIMINDRLDMYDRVKKYCENYNLDHVNIYQNSLLDNVSQTILLKDYVHTNQYGAQYYAECIYRFLYYNIFHLPDEPVHSSYNRIYPAKNKYVDIKYYEPLQTMCIYKYLTLQISDEMLGIFQTIGPYSGIVEIFDSNNNKLISSEKVWDTWCHYERKTIKLSISMPGVYNLLLQNNSIVDKSSAKIQLKWTEHRNILKIHKFFYTGVLKILDYE